MDREQLRTLPHRLLPVLGFALLLLGGMAAALSGIPRAAAQPASTADLAARMGRLPVSPDANPSVCTAVISSTFAPDHVRMCDPLGVTLTLGTVCPSCPDGMNVVIIQDDTPYDDWQKRVSLQALGEIENWARRGHKISVGVIHYNGQGVRRALEPTMNVMAARGPLVGFKVQHDPRALFMEAAQEGVQMIKRGRRLHGGKASPECEFVIFFVYTKIYMADKGQEMIQAGRTLLREVDNLFVGCPHQHPEECTIWEPQVPESQRYYTEDPEPSKLRNLVQEAFSDIETKGVVKLRTLTIDQWLPPGMAVEPGSFNIAPNKMIDDGGRSKLTWSWRLPPMGRPMTLTYKAKPLLPGDWRADMKLSLVDSENRRKELAVSSLPVTLENDFCPTPTTAPTPTPTSTDEPTPWPSPSSTATPVPTPQPSPTSRPPTATPRPKPIYIPMIVGEACERQKVNADVALVLDISTSMNRPTRSGRTKLAATLDAAKAFVGLMDLTADEHGISDQVAVVGFNHHAWIQAPLGRDRAGILQAIDHLADGQAEFTRLDLAMEVGAQAILGGARTLANTPVLVLLTDGLPNRVPLAEDGTMETTVLRAAAAAHRAGIVVYAIAIGAPEDTNPDLLRATAGDPANYYYTPDPEDLDTIYQTIARDFGCPPDRFWGGR